MDIEVKRNSRSETGLSLGLEGLVNHPRFLLSTLVADSILLQRNVEGSERILNANKEANNSLLQAHGYHPELLITVYSMLCRFIQTPESEGDTGHEPVVNFSSTRGQERSKQEAQRDNRTPLDKFLFRNSNPDQGGVDKSRREVAITASRALNQCECNDDNKGAVVDPIREEARRRAILAREISQETAVNEILELCQVLAGAELVADARDLYKLAEGTTESGVETKDILELLVKIQKLNGIAEVAIPRENGDKLQKAHQRARKIIEEKDKNRILIAFTVIVNVVDVFSNEAIQKINTLETDGVDRSIILGLRTVNIALLGLSGGLKEKLGDLLSLREKYLDSAPHTSSSPGSDDRLSESLLKLAKSVAKMLSDVSDSHRKSSTLDISSLLTECLTPLTEFVEAAKSAWQPNSTARWDELFKNTNNLKIILRN